jgi:hypothetical protein
MCSTCVAPTKHQDCVAVLDECLPCGYNALEHADTYGQEQIANGIVMLSSSEEEDVPTFVAHMSAEHKVTNENCRRSTSDFLQNLLNAYDGGGSDFFLDLSDDNDDSNEPS